MKLTLASISPRAQPKSEPTELLVRDFLTRIIRYTPADAQVFDAEARLLAAAGRKPGQPAAALLLCDSRGDLLTSEQFADTLGKLRDSGRQRILLAIGPANGWSDAARARADHLLSFGRITLPHELARVVLAEQTYRALTLLAGHPYHSGH